MKIDLLPLPHTSDFDVTAEITARGSGSLLRIKLMGDISEVSLSGSDHDELWRDTCFELFVRDKHCDGYEEINCSPDGRFSRTYLSSYRKAHSAGDFQIQPEIICKYHEDFCEYEINLFGIDIVQREIAVAVITADEDGVRRFWGVSHKGELPDFHHDDNFFRFDFS